MAHPPSSLTMCGTTARSTTTRSWRPSKMPPASPHARPGLAGGTGMWIGERRGGRAARSRTAVWHPIGGAAGAGDVLPPAEVLERTQILVRSASGGEPRQLPVDELGQAIRDGRLAIWIDLPRPQDQASGLLRDCLGLG